MSIINMKFAGVPYVQAEPFKFEQNFKMKAKMAEQYLFVCFDRV